MSTTLQELESGLGYAVTGGGSLLPMTDVIRLASHAHHYLTVYDKHTSEPLYLARTKRFATAAQRIVLHSRGPRVHYAVLDASKDAERR